MCIKPDYQNYLNWAMPESPRMNPIEFDRANCSPELAQILDHGMIINGVCMARGKMPMPLP